MKILLLSKYGLFLAEHKNVYFTEALTITAEENSCHGFFFSSLSLDSTVLETHHWINYSVINYKHENEKEAMVSKSTEIKFFCFF